jgi:hypothetical protein
VFDLMTTWIERYRRQVEERYRRLDRLLAEDSPTAGRQAREQAREGEGA